MPKVHQVGSPELPPAGYKRDEELKLRTDTLAREAETRGGEVEAIDPSRLKVDPELAQYFDILHVSNADPTYKYFWVFTGQHGLFIKKKLIVGYEIVQGDMPEAIELKGMGGDTTRKLGDVVLMRIRIDQWKKLDRLEEAKRAAQQGSVLSPIRELAEKNARHGINVYTQDSMPEQYLKRMQARSIAQNKMAQMVREGNVPGRPAPGVG